MARDIGEQMIIAEWLFVETVNDIRHRSQNPIKRRRYELLGIAPLLRKLLFDGASLLETVKVARPEIPVEFRIRSWDETKDNFEDEGLERYIGLAGPDLLGGTHTPPIRSVHDLSKTVVGIAQGEPLTVRSIIRYYAHVEGGVHFGRPREPGQSTLNVMAPLLLGHSTGQIRILAYLGQVVTDALEPLRRSILTQPTVHRLLHIKDERGLYIGHWTTEHHEKID